MRLDQALVSRGFFESRAKAQEAIAAGLVSVNGQVARKASQDLGDQDALSAQAAYPWVSRGGVKLAHALQHFGLDVTDRICLDVGASTGGFTHVLLHAGARKVYAVEVGHGQLHASLREEARVINLEQQDARLLGPQLMPEQPSLIVCDASFIPLRDVLVPVLGLAAPQADLVTLIKPQFEVGRQENKKGIVRDAAVHRRVCAVNVAMIAAQGWQVHGVIESPIFGGDGNKEFLLHASRGAEQAGTGR